LSGAEGVNGLKVGLFGFGKAGRAVATVILNNKDFVLEWVIRNTKTLDHRSAPEFLGIESSEPGLIYAKDEFNKIIQDPSMGVDAIIDFSSPESVYEYGEYVRKNGVAIVSAISNYGPTELDYLREIGKSTRVLCSPNITVGINFLIIASKVLKRIAPYADIEIIEEHFKKKQEVSGTAKAISRHLALDPGEIKTIRAGGIIGRHEILFGFPYQTVRLSHESISREAFGNGALFALDNIKGLPAGFYTMEDVIKPFFTE
jgi:4-hydroxy-tetrahydrodipicolinate reductase